MRSHDPNDMYGSGLNFDDWTALKNAVLDAGYGNTQNVDIPPHLRDHEVAQVIRQSLDGNKEVITRAAELLVPVHPSGAWITLEKS